MFVKIRRSPNPRKKFRVILEDGRTVDFGARGYSDYTKHKSPSRMRLYVLRHGGKVPKSTMSEKNPNRIHKLMQNVSHSDKEDWTMGGIDSAGFWSRWYLWSFPDPQDVKKFMSKKFGITLLPTYPSSS